MIRSAPIYPLRLFAYGGALTAFALSLWLLGASQQLNEQPIQAAAQETTQGYYASLVDQHVVIYLNGRTEPILITDIDVRTLPDADQKLLQEGLPLKSAEDVNRLLEDYDS